MAFKIIQKIPDAKELMAKVPLTEELRQVKKERDQELRRIIEGKSKKFLIIVGPCSADNEDALCDYATRLAKVYEQVKDKLFIVPRVYTNKPRTTGEGYKGMLHQPDPNAKPDVAAGILAIRSMHMRVIRETGLTAADEMLYPENLTYCEDLLSYIAIGARSVENQQHRLTCSGVDIPVGMKNPTSGDFGVMYNAVQAAQASHSFLFNGYEVETEGNPLTHAILRGAVHRYGGNRPNYHFEEMRRAVEMYYERNLANPFIVVDCNHNNSGKKHHEQPRIVSEILYSRRHNTEIEKVVRGLMIESYIEEGSQDISGGVYGKSITDPCLGWEDTEKLLYSIADKV